MVKGGSRRPRPHAGCARLSSAHRGPVNSRSEPERLRQSTESQLQVRRDSGRNRRGSGRNRKGSRGKQRGSGRNRIGSRRNRRGSGRNRRGPGDEVPPVSFASGPILARRCRAALADTGASLLRQGKVPWGVLRLCGWWRGAVVVDERPQVAEGRQTCSAAVSKGED